jgi:iron complex transport system substrate-binding protein
LLVVAVLAIVAVTGCGGGTSSSADTTRSGDARPDAGRVVALGEERVLADLLALGIRPVASTANVVVDDGFVGLDEFDTSGIEPIPSTDPNIERLAALQADVIVANEFVADYLGRDVLDGLGRVVVVPDGDAKTQIVALGDAFDRRAEAHALVAEHDEAIAEGRTALATLPEASRTVSVATIYPGPTVAAWVDGPVDVPATLLALGFVLRPDAAAVAGTEGGNTEGRAYLFEEQLGLFDAPTIIAMQSDHVEGEADALAAMADSPLWAGLPAVRNDRVITVDRLGYPGIAGQTRLVEDLVQKLGA